MRTIAAIGAAAVLMASANFVSADAIESGIAVGKKVPAFQVVKVGGAEDGVKVGQQLCYR